MKEVKIYYTVVAVLMGIALIIASVYHKTEYGTVTTVCMSNGKPTMDVQTLNGDHIKDLPNERNFELGDQVTVEVGVFKNKVHAR